MTASGMDSRTSLVCEDNVSGQLVKKDIGYNDNETKKVTAGERLYDKTCVCVCGIGIGIGRYADRDRCG